MDNDDNIADFGGRVQPATTLLQNLSSEDAEVRARSLFQLSIVSGLNSRAVDPIAPLLDDPDELVRLYAFDSMGAIGRPAARIADIIRRQLHEGPHYLQMAAHRALQRICRDEILPKPQWTGDKPYPCPYFWPLRKYGKRIYHYQVTFPILRPLVLGILHSDWRRIALETEDGRVLNLTCLSWSPAWGTRPFDAPVLSRCTRRVNSVKVSNYLQKRYETPPIRLHRELRAKMSATSWYIESDTLDGIVGLDPETNGPLVTNYEAAKFLG